MARSIPQSARGIALSLLLRSERQKQFSNLALDHALAESTLSTEDRALCATLFYGVIEKRLLLDHRLSALSDRPLSELDAEVLCALRLGLYQLMLLDRIPPHAAIYETVALCQRKSAGFVNAVLRSHTRTAPTPLPDPKTDPVRHLSIRFSVGQALVSRLVSVFGEARAESILAAIDRHPATTLRVNTLKTDRESLAKRIAEAEPTALSSTGLSIRGALRDASGFEEGHFFVQDEASQLCVEAIAPQRGETVLDICACPGSKSFGMAIRMENEGHIHAFDLHKSKLSLILSGASRLGISIIEATQNDGRNFLPEWEERADRVLCDVPCSGFGVLAKKPELRYKDPAESAALPDIQLAILETACRYVKRGGILVYSTCTVLPEENEGNVARFLARHPEFSLAPFSAGALDVPSGQLTLLPDTTPTDGFFIAKLIKNDR